MTIEQTSDPVVSDAGLCRKDTAGLRSTSYLGLTLAS